MILYQKNDSTYVSADTLFSGLRMYEAKTTAPAKIDSSYLFPEQVDSTILVGTDTAVNVSNLPTVSNDSIRYFLAFHNVKIFTKELRCKYM